MKTGTYRILALTPVILIVVFCREALALQTHGGSEGVVVHQLAHLQYFGALGYLYWDIRRSSFAGVGWRYLQLFCLLMMTWNVVAFIGHFAQMALPEGAISTEDGYLSALLLLPIHSGKWIYLITALDHLVITPALFFLFLAMRSFSRAAEHDRSEEE